MYPMWRSLFYLVLNKPLDKNEINAYDYIHCYGLTGCNKFTEGVKYV